MQRVFEGAEKPAQRVFSQATIHLDSPIKWRSTLAEFKALKALVDAGAADKDPVLLKKLAAFSGKRFVLSAEKFYENLSGEVEEVGTIGKENISLPGDEGSTDPPWEWPVKAPNHLPDGARVYDHISAEDVGPLPPPTEFKKKLVGKVDPQIPNLVSCTGLQLKKYLIRQVQRSSLWVGDVLDHYRTRQHEHEHMLRAVANELRDAEERGAEGSMSSKEARPAAGTEVPEEETARSKRFRHLTIPETITEEVLRGTVLFYGSTKIGDSDFVRDVFLQRAGDVEAGFSTPPQQQATRVGHENGGGSSTAGEGPQQQVEGEDPQQQGKDHGPPRDWFSDELDGEALLAAERKPETGLLALRKAAELAEKKLAKTVEREQNKAKGKASAAKDSESSCSSSNGNGIIPADRGLDHISALYTLPPIHSRKFHLVFLDPDTNQNGNRLSGSRSELEHFKGFKPPLPVKFSVPLTEESQASQEETEKIRRENWMPSYVLHVTDVGFEGFSGLFSRPLLLDSNSVSVDKFPETNKLSWVERKVFAKTVENAQR